MCEDWRGKAAKEDIKIAELRQSPVKKRAKPSYLDKCPEWQHIKNTKVSKLLAFKNGLFYPPVKMEKYRLNLLKTCAFDSSFQVIMNAMASNSVYYEILEKSTNQIILLALKILKEDDTKRNSRWLVISKEPIYFSDLDCSKSKRSRGR